MARWACAALVGLVAVIVPSLVRAQESQEQIASTPDAGKRLFETVCIACHTIGGGVRIGPDLQGVTERRDRAWLVRFISDPERVIGAKATRSRRPTWRGTACGCPTSV
jgi:mono/diheme cytochrome c family protein